MFKKTFYSLAVAIALGVFLPSKASADVPPIPEMEFNIVFETTKQISLVGGEQLGCKDKLCTDIKPSGLFNLKQFRCFENLCTSRDFGRSPYYKLILNFSDKIRESNVFSTELIDAGFDVIVTDDYLIVKKSALTAQRENVPLFMVALLLTLSLELLISLIYFSIKKIPEHVLVSVFVANVISLPLVWFMFPQLMLPFTTIVLMSETFAVVFETFFVYLLNKQLISLGQSAALNLMNNFASLIIGGFIYTFLGLW